MGDDSTYNERDFHVIDENITTLVSNSDRGDKNMSDNQSPANDFEYQRTHGVKPESEATSKQVILSENQDDLNGVTSAQKNGHELTDSETQIMSFQATDCDGVNGQGHLSSTEELTSETGPTQQPAGSEVEVTDRDTNKFTDNKCDIEQNLDVKETKKSIQDNQQQGETLNNGQVPLDKHLELVMVELRPLIQPIREGEDSNCNELSEESNGIVQQLQTGEANSEESSSKSEDSEQEIHEPTSRVSNDSGEGPEEETHKNLNGTSVVLDDTAEFLSPKDQTNDSIVSGQSIKTNNVDQCQSPAKPSSKRQSDSRKFKSQLIGIDEISWDSQSASCAHQQKRPDSHAPRRQMNVNSSINSSISHKKSITDQTNGKLLTKKSTLITTPNQPYSDRTADFADERKSNQTNYCVESVQGINFINRDHYDPFARKNLPRQSNLDGSTTTPRPSVSIYERPYTKHELRRALPRRSCFSCHDKAMKDAGFEVDDPVAKRKAERLKAKLDRIAKEFDPLPKYKTATGQEQTDKGIAKTDVKVASIDVTVEDSTKQFDKQSETMELTEASNDNAEDAVEKTTETGPSLKTLGITSKKKQPGSSKIEHVDCKPLSFYLEYIKGNGQEYLQHVHSTHTPARDKPIASLIKLGRAFELRHQGGWSKHQGEDLVLMAAKALRPRTADPAKISRSTKDKRLWTPETGIRAPRAQPEDKRQADKGTTGSTSNTAGPTAKEEELPKTELEKRKQKAEDWSRSVSTSLLTRAKIQSLRELGSDDSELTKWWEAFKHCHYIRQNPP